MVVKRKKGKEEMDFLELFRGLGSFAQLALVVGCFATIFLVAYNRTAANNLTIFLRTLHVNIGIKRVFRYFGEAVLREKKHIDMM